MITSQTFRWFSLSLSLSSLSLSRSLAFSLSLSLSRANTHTLNLIESAPRDAYLLPVNSKEGAQEEESKEQAQEEIVILDKVPAAALRGSMLTSEVEEADVFRVP